jgi:exopolysaccharide production protein ExoZ
MQYTRFLFYGVPTALFLYASISIEKLARPWLGGILLLLGDASYSIYLSHGFVIPPLAEAWHILHWKGALSVYAFIAACLVISSVFGIGVHLFLEKPMMKFLNRKALGKNEGPNPVVLAVTK